MIFLWFCLLFRFKICHVLKVKGEFTLSFSLQIRFKHCIIDPLNIERKMDRCLDSQICVWNASNVLHDVFRLQICLQILQFALGIYEKILKISKGVIRIRKSKDRQHNSQKEKKTKDQTTIYKILHIKLKIE